jgi:hypothetical protein
MAAGMKVTDFRNVALCSLEQVHWHFSAAYSLNQQTDLMTETVTTPETSTNLYRTMQRNIPEVSHIHINSCFRSN